MTARQRALSWLIAVAGFGWGWFAWEHQGAGRSLPSTLSDPLVGWVCIGAGLVIRSYRPRNACWWLVTAAGFAWYTLLLTSEVHGDLGLLAFATVGWYDGLLTWALLAYPLGRVQFRRERLLLAVLLALFAVRSLARLFLYVPEDVTGCACLTNRWLPVSDERWWRGVEQVFDAAYPLLALLVVASVAARWLRASGPVRQMVFPSLVSGVVLAVTAMFVRFADPIDNVLLAPAPSYLLAYWAPAAVAVTLAIGFVTLRRARSSVVDLVSELGEDAPPSQLADALRRALDDPTLTLLPWSSDRRAYVDDDGQPAAPDPPEPGRAVTRIERRGEPVGLLVHDAALLEDPGLVRGVTAAVTLSVDNERLYAATRAQLAEVAASRARIVAAGDAERRRIERDLHDGAQQRLVTIALSLRLAEARMPPDGDPSTRDALRQAAKDLSAAIDELRDLARGIHPALLTESGLRAALEALTDRCPVPTLLDVELDAEPPGPVAATLYFAVSEALTNVAKHAQANSVVVTVRRADDEVRISVTDDGRGGADPADGTGLRGLADRVAAGGGTLTVSSPAGGGTIVEVRMPCGSS